MEKLKSYVLCIAAAAILIGILTEISNSKSGPGMLLRISAGLFLTLQLLSPLTELHPEYWTEYFGDLMSTGESISSESAAMASEQMEEIIKHRTRTYILDKAEPFQAGLSVEVELDNGQSPVPVSVTVTGEISPYGRNVLQRMIATDLNIPKERQQWIGN